MFNYCRILEGKIQHHCTHLKHCVDLKGIPLSLSSLGHGRNSPKAGDPSAGTDRVLVTYEKSLVMEDLPPEEVRGRQVTLRADGLPNLDPLRKAGGTTWTWHIRCVHTQYIFIYRFILFIAYDIDYILFVIFINYYVYYVFYANHMRYRTYT